MNDSYTDIAWKNGFKMGYKKGLKEGQQTEIRWHDVEDEQRPKHAEYCLVSFANYGMIALGMYVETEDGGGYFCSDLDEKGYSKLGLIVEGWAELPKPLHEMGGK